jgi:signal transduction histidine kinase
MKTWYAPPERADAKEIDRQNRLFTSNVLLVETLEAISMAVLVLNNQRQVVHANRAFLEMAGHSSEENIRGLRVGETIGCIYSGKEEGGCGTSEYCRECGAVRAILSGVNGIQDIQECRINLHDDNQALDLRVMATPLRHQDEDFIVFSILDIRIEKRKELVERLFVHDVRNTAGGILGFSQLLKDRSANDTDGVAPMISELAGQLLNEIDSYRQLVNAESGTLKVGQNAIRTGMFLERIRNLYLAHEVGKDRTVDIDPGSEDIHMSSDETILGRVIGNLVKNALEATQPGMQVTLACRMEGDMVRFSVHNPGIIPRNNQLQIFQRSFSTKGAGRGIGTYSVKLLGEQYLGGKVGFTSDETGGTVFYGIFPRNLQPEG